MREILFRGKRVDNGEWVYGDLIQSYENADYYLIMYNNVAFRVIPETVGQFTGLTDKNGKRIFEGDIVKRSTAPLKDEILSIFYNGTHTCYAMKSNYGCTYEPISDFVPIEVVGNIFDNPELL